jgi:two-component system, NarL family, invasion response regulator UvrY
MIRSGRSEGQLVRILVVDDNPTVRHYLRAILEQQNTWRVLEARTGEEALRRVESESPNIVLLDFRLPDLNGLDVAREIARQHAEMPILMVTVYLSGQLEAEAKAAGIRGACAKSDIGSIVEAVQALLRNETYFPGAKSQDRLAI